MPSSKTEGTSNTSSSWVKAGAGRTASPAGPTTGSELSGVLGSQMSSLTAKWALRPRREGEAQPDWEAAITQMSEAREDGGPSLPLDTLVRGIKRALATIAST